MDGQIAKIVTLSVLSFFSVCGFVLFFTGYGLSYDSCAKVPLSEGEICSETYYERWWAVTLQIVSTAGIALAIGVGKLEENLITALGFLVLSAAVLMESINASIWSIEFGKAGQVVHAEVASAGLLILILVDCAGIVLLGLQYHKHEKRSTEWPWQKTASTVIAGLFVAAGLGLMLGGVIPQEIACAKEDIVQAAQACSYKLRFTWWTIAFESAVAVWVLAALLTGWMDRMAVPIAAFLALVTSNLMDEADVALTNILSEKVLKTDLVAAGVLLLCIVNMVLLIGFAVGGVLTSDRHEVEPAAEGQSAWVISTGVTALPLLLGLGMALTGVARMHSKHCREHCTKFFRSSYWAFAFELFLIIVICSLVLFKRDALPEVRGIVQIFLVLASLETMREVGKMLSNELETEIGYKNVSFSGNTSVGIAAAGYIVVTAMNFVLMLVLGCEVPTEGNSAGYEPAPV